MSQHPTGKFIATVRKVTVGESTKKGTPGVFFDFETGEGAIEGTLWLSERAYARTLNTLRECFGFNDDFSTLAEQSEGKQVNIDVQMEPDEKGEKEWPRVKWINPLRAAAKPVAGGLLAQLSARAKVVARPAGAPAANAKVTPKPTPTPKPAANDEDVPF